MKMEGMHQDAQSNEEADANTNMTPVTFPLNRLPAELRELVWLATLPGQRVFHISNFVNPAVIRACDVSDDDIEEAAAGEPAGDQSPLGRESSGPPLAQTEALMMDARSRSSATAARRQGSSNAWPPSQGVDSTELPQRSFQFHIHHPPPMATRVCKESREVALRHGFFLSAYPEYGLTGVWFRPEIDILYVSRSSRQVLLAGPRLDPVRRRNGEYQSVTRGYITAPSAHPTIGQASLRPPSKYQPFWDVPGWDRVLHVGIEWRAFFRDLTCRPSTPTMLKYWRTALTPLHVYMPKLQTVNYILPIRRHVGNVTWGREPHGATEFDARLVPLPDETTIPWEASLRVVAGQQLAAEGDGDGQAPPPANAAEVVEEFVSRLGGRTACPVTWDVVREDMRTALEQIDGRGKDGDEGAEWDVWRRNADGEEREVATEIPKVVGWWLVRDGAPQNNDHPRVRTFNSPSIPHEL